VRFLASLLIGLLAGAIAMWFKSPAWAVFMVAYIASALSDIRISLRDRP
jgi:uncharacterized membrane protein YjjB (DUF3815 family)